MGGQFIQGVGLIPDIPASEHGVSAAAEELPAAGDKAETKNRTLVCLFDIPGYHHVFRIYKIDISVAGSGDQLRFFRVSDQAADTFSRQGEAFQASFLGDRPFVEHAVAACAVQVVALSEQGKKSFGMYGDVFGVLRVV